MNEAAVVSLETSATTAALDEALAKAQGEIEIAGKDKVNPAFRSRYADLTSMWTAARPALTKHCIAVTQWPLASTDIATGRRISPEPPGYWSVSARMPATAPAST
jgi:hypothetical protein